MSSADQPIYPPRPFRVILGPLIAAFVGMYSEAALNIALPDLMVQFGVSAAVVQWLTTGYLLAVAILLPLFGLLVRWFPTRRLVSAAVVLFVVGAAASATATTFGVLIAGRVVQGAVTGILLPLVFNTAIAVYPPRRIGTGLGMIGLVVMFAPAIGPVLAGIILEAASWTWIFWLMIPVVLVAWGVSGMWLENVRPITRPHVDAVSILLSTLGFGGLILALGLGGEAGWMNPVVLVSLVLGVIGIGGFAWRQLSVADPMLNLRAFGHRDFALSALIIIANNAMLLSAIFLIPMYLQNARLTSVLAAGLLMLPGGILNGLLSALAGRAADVVRPHLLVRIGLAVAVLGSLALMLQGEVTPLWWLIAGHCLLMVGISMASSPTQAVGLGCLPQELSSDGSTVLSTLMQVGGAIGTALGASLLAAGQRAAGGEGGAAVIAGVRWGFAFSVAMAVTGLAISFGIGRAGRPAPSGQDVGKATGASAMLAP